MGYLNYNLEKLANNIDAAAAKFGANRGLAGSSPASSADYMKYQGATSAPFGASQPVSQPTPAEGPLMTTPRSPQLPGARNAARQAASQAARQAARPVMSHPAIRPATPGS